ncbi:AAA family ATPase [Methanobrevibacter filiformis]|uniref:Endonuclease GajA/Old nuclease/RecF-like AAA domain-containing protein n=1 Tax=Methanobrevibacter filiformis TaxID=55758 RepID=A0A165YXN6_9EURY|nr:AAA family ATPase [Methanobrevibacter filiformis]KZX09993.1 hypothetical protein MBFIL_19430 [Methanobrevibacter filiformis]
MLTNLKIENFKTFKNIDINLKNFNLLIGSNASGKSNFVSIFRFLNDIANVGLNDAISNQGGIKYLKNLINENNTPLKIETKAEEKFGFPVIEKEIHYFIEIFDIDYKLSIDFIENSGFQVNHECVKLNGSIDELDVKKIKPDQSNVNKCKLGKEKNITEDSHLMFLYLFYFIDFFFIFCVFM